MTDFSQGPKYTTVGCVSSQKYHERNFHGIIWESEKYKNVLQSNIFPAFKTFFEEIWRVNL